VIDEDVRAKFIGRPRSLVRRTDAAGCYLLSNAQGAKRLVPIGPLLGPTPRLDRLSKQAKAKMRSAPRRAR
jgi:hypothetical protein